MKKPFILILLLVVKVGLMANPITRQQALKKVESFLASKGKTYRAPSRRSSEVVTETKSEGYYYVFNLGAEEGYVIASGDDCTPSILGYSEKGYIGDSIPDNMQFWLDEYKSQIQYMRENGISYSGSVNSDNPAIAPLLTTTWNQGDPYNMNCPDFFTYGKSVTGCVATAMAQVMYYHRHHSITKTTTEIPAYECRTNWTDYGHVSVNAIPAGSVIDWDNMLNDYSGTSTSTQKQAVANLMAYCGASVKMNYADALNGGSGASSSNVPVALIKYFDYNEGMSLQYRTDDTTNDAWNNLIYSELSKGNPVYYSGQNNSSGHAFVCDGYDGNGYFHINWGWGGKSDGNFLLSALEPKSQGIGGSSSGYNMNQAALIGAIPNGEIVRLTTHDILLTGSTNFQIGSSSSISLPIRLILKNLNDATYSFDYAIGLYSNGNFVEVLQNQGTYSNLSASSQITRNVTLTVNTSLSDGTYQLIPLSKKAGTNAWQKNNNSSEKFITLVKRNGAMTFCVGTPSVSGTIINFADANVKSFCVQNWDINGDGELSTEEAATVTDLGTVFKGRSAIKSFDELRHFTGLTSICSSAFSGCSGLTSIVIPNNVTSIKSSAFYNCYNITSINIPNSVTSISDNPFQKCSALATITVESGNTNYDSRNNCNAIVRKSDNTLIVGCKNTVIPNNVAKIGNEAFYYCSGLKSITIPNSVTSIGSSAFNNCSTISSITIPSNVTSIEGNPFESCSALATITVASGNTVYDSRNNCNAIIRKSDNTLIAGCKNSVIPTDVASIGRGAFYGCSNLSSIIIPDGVTSIGYAAFDLCSGLTSITLPKNITSIGNYAFYGCSNLTSVKAEMQTPVTISSNVFSNRANATLSVPHGSKTAYESADYWKEFKEIAEYTDDTIINFADENVKSLCVQNWDINGDGELSTEEAATVTDLGAAFKYNNTIKTFDELKHFTGLTSISSYTFSFCSGLTSIIIPNNVTSIGSSAFSHCTGLKSIIIPNSVTSIGSSAFDGCSTITSVTIPSNVTSIGDNPFQSCRALATITVESGNTVYDSRNNCNAIIRKSDNTLIVGCKNTVIPNNIVKIGNYAFYYCSGLTTITLPNSVTSIGSRAFASCSAITSITIPSNVTSTGDNPFEGCSALATITVASGNTVYDSRNNCNAIIRKSDNTLIAGCKNSVIPTDVASIGRGAFYGCSNLSSIIIPDGVTSIGYSAFEFCSDLTSITLPKSITSIGNYSFSFCSKLTSIKAEMQTPVTISSNVFSNRANATLSVPHGSKTAYESADYWKEFKVIVEYTDNLIINFADENVKSLCVQNWDTNGDGELSMSEAAAVTDLGTVFKGRNAIKAFDELEHFTGLTSISSYAFSGCSGLTSIVIPNNVTSIGSSAFAGCSTVTSITIPSNVTTIGNSAFYNCSGLTSITIPNSVTSIGLLAFYNCSGLTAIYIPNSVTSIDESAFAYCSAITSITIPSNVTSIGYNPFAGCSALATITVASGNTVYDSRNNCNAIIRKSDNTLIAGCKNSVIPTDVTYIGSNAFYGCRYLSSIIIPGGVTTICYDAFRSCSGLTSITLPKSITSIGSSAFYGCSKLTTVKAEMPTPITISSNVFSNRSNATLSVPHGSKTAYESADYWKEFKEIIEMAATGIGVLAPESGEESIYNLGGQYVTNPTKKGLYIINGKKIIIK